MGILILSCVDINISFENSAPGQTISEPASKKRKLGLSGPSASKKNQNGSFTEVLEKLNIEAKETGGMLRCFHPLTRRSLSFLQYQRLKAVRIAGRGLRLLL